MRPIASAARPPDAQKVSDLPAGRLRKRPCGTQFFILTSSQTEPFDKHLFVVSSQTRGGSAHPSRSFTQVIRNHSIVVIAEFRVTLLLPDVTESYLWIREEIAHGVH